MEIESTFSFKWALAAALFIAAAGCTTTTARSTAAKTGNPDKAALAAQTGPAAKLQKTSTAWAPSQQSQQNGQQIAAQKNLAGGIAPGTVVSISNAQDEKLRGKFRIDPDGSLKLPYGVQLQTAGMSEQQLRQQIAKSYANYFKSPSDLHVAISREFYVDVRGLVDKAGRYVIPPTASLDEVIAKAGGLIKGKDGDPAAQYVRIKQPNGNVSVVRLSEYFGGNEGLVPAWQGGDVIFFQSEKGQVVQTSGSQGAGNYVHILGQVVTPGDYQVRPDATMFDYIISAGGPTSDAELGRVLLVRQGEKEPKMYSLENARDLPSMQQGDTLIVMGGSRTETERSLGISSQLAAVVSSLATVALLAVTL